jgi:hypothetical protein
MLALVGEMETATGAVTVTTEEADFVGSATLVAFTVYEPAVEGAVYKPAEVTVPPVAVQVTLVLLEPVTVAVNWLCCPVCRVTPEAGEIVTATAAFTVTVAVAVLVVSAALVAVTV